MNHDLTVMLLGALEIQTTLNEAARFLSPKPEKSYFTQSATEIVVAKLVMKPISAICFKSLLLPA